MSLEVTVLGSSGSRTGPGRACSGYLFEAGGTRVMVDCGNGSTANLQRRLGFRDLDAVLITHRHADHCVDLIGMFYELKFGGDGPTKMQLYAAPEVDDMLAGLLSHDSALEFRELFPCQVVDGGDTLEVGELAFEFFPSVHPVPTVSVRVSAGGRTVCYSADSHGGPDLVEAARGADLFLCEATWLGDMSEWPEGLHLTASGAGAVATRAEVDRLVLTHLWPDNDRERALAECRREWSGALALAEDNESWTVV